MGLNTGAKKTMGFDCLLFDLDGTLVDSLPDLATAINLLRSDYGLAPLSIAQVTSYVGDGATALVKRALPQGAFEQQKLQRFLRYYAEHLSDKTRPYPGIVELLQRLPQIPKVIVTNKPQQMAAQLVAELGLSPYFKLILGGDSCAHKKPHPEPLVTALACLDLSAATSLMIGDHHTDLRAALAAGIPACFCRWGYGNEGGEHPQFSVASIPELERLLAGS